MKAQKTKLRGVYEKVPGSGIWWVRHIDAEGRLRREIAGTWTCARDLYRKRKNAALEGKKLQKLRQRPATFAEIAETARQDIERRHRRAQDGLRQLDRAVEWFGPREAASIGPSEIESALSAAAESGRWAASTYNHHLNIVSLTYKLALRSGNVAVNPARQVPRRREENVRQGFITGVQHAALSHRCDSLWLRTMLALGYNYGWRAGELISLRVSQVDENARTIRLEPGTTKNRDGRVIRLTGQCFQLVKACIAGKGKDESIFTHEDGQPVRAYRYGWEQLCVSAGLGKFVCGTCGAEGKATSAAGRVCPECSKAKYPLGRRGVLRYRGLLFHDLRRSAVRNLERASVPRSVAMKITGHRTESVYRRYAIVSEADLAEAVTRLERASQIELTPLLTPGQRQDKAGSAKVQ